MVNITQKYPSLLTSTVVGKISGQYHLKFIFVPCHKCQAIQYSGISSLRMTHSALVKTSLTTEAIYLWNICLLKSPPVCQSIFPNNSESVNSKIGWARWWIENGVWNTMSHLPPNPTHQSSIFALQNVNDEEASKREVGFLCKPSHLRAWGRSLFPVKEYHRRAAQRARPCQGGQVCFEKLKNILRPFT